MALIPLKDCPLYTKMIPSKLFEVMGMGLPVLLAMPEGEATGIVRQTGAGIVVPPEQPEALVAAVLELFTYPQRLELLGRASHMAAKYFSRFQQAEKMLTVLQSIMKGKGEAARESI